jgi:hypothetical protein
MPTRRTSYADLLSDWESLLQTCSANEDRLPCLRQTLVPLEALLKEVRELRTMRTGLGGSSKLVTRHLRDMREAGRESARRVRSLVKAHLGTKSEELEQFGIAPQRPRRKAQ